MPPGTRAGADARRPPGQAAERLPPVVFAHFVKFLQTERGLLCALLLLAAALALGTSEWGNLYNETDGQYGGAAKVMAQGGSWIIPENNGVPRLVKPPLLYWT